MPRKLSSSRVNSVSGQSFKSGYGDSIIQKGSIMDHPGTMITNVIYSDATNTFKQSLELAMHTPSNPDFLDNLNFGRGGSVTMSASEPVLMFALHLQLPAFPKDVNAAAGWGYNCITKVNYQFGAQNGGSIEIEREAIKHLILLSCSTTEMRNKLIEFGGREVLGEQDPSEVNDAVIFLAVPGSLPVNDKIRTPIPLNIVTGTGLTITVTFAPREQFLTGAGVATLPFSAFNKGILFHRKVAVSNNSVVPNINEISNDMAATYPLIKAEQTIKTLPAGTAGLLRSVTLDGISDGDLIGISMAILPDSKYQTDTSSYTNPTNAFDYGDIYDVEIKKSSTSIDSSPNTSDINKFFNTAAGGAGGFDFEIPIRTSVGANEPFWTEPAEKTIYYWNNTLRRAHTEPNYMHNAPRYSTGTMTLSFRTSTTEGFTLYIIYHYTSLLKFMKTKSIQST